VLLLSWTDLGTYYTQRSLPSLILRQLGRVARPSSLFFVVIPFALIFWGRSCAYATDLLGMVVVSRCLYYCYSEVAGRDVLIVPPVLSRLGLFAVHLKLHEVL